MALNDLRIVLNRNGATVYTGPASMIVMEDFHPARQQHRSYDSSRCTKWLLSDTHANSVCITSSDAL